MVALARAGGARPGTASATGIGSQEHSDLATPAAPGIGGIAHACAISRERNACHVIAGHVDQLERHQAITIHTHREEEATSMSAEDNKAVSRRLFAAMTEGNVDAVDALFTPDAVVHDPGRELRGTATIREGLRALRAAFPDIVYTVEDQLAEGDKVASRYRGEGTHLGDWRGVPATGRRFSYTGILIHRFEGNRIAEFWGQADTLGLLQQLGAWPPSS